MIGTGYVGLVTGACLAEMGNTWCAWTSTPQDRHPERGGIPIHEPGLHADGAAQRRRRAACASPPTWRGGGARHAAVHRRGHAADEDGSADLQYVLAAARASAAT
jgi:UDPglucose 6-dehydrogenase